MITVYDLGPTSVPRSSELGFSSHVRKVILILRYKKLPHKISVIGFDDIEPLARQLGAPPSRTKPDGSPKYTVPFIQDSATGKGVSDSFLIAQYLDEAYPDTPRVVPDGTRVLQAAFVNDFQTKFMPLFAVLGAKFRTFFPQEFLEGQKKAYGEGAITPELSLKEQEAIWDKVKGSFDTLGNAFVKDEKFVMGDKPTLADFTIVAWLWNVQVAYGENSSEWKNVSQWLGGRVANLCRELI
ncbi:hypothetical protein V5O48_018845 [Marasmius crinis-equi]|uniref:Glutathione S-transferase n=1 Tax=Marasmius crinis-equi TaxID=585013 RepID=A0ABR3EK40_9AGAR